MTDYSSSQKKYQPRTMLTRLEEHASQIYTLELFRKVQAQIRREALHYVQSVIDDNINRVFMLDCYALEKGNAQVSCAKMVPQICCSCLHFETFGIPCGHLFHIAKVEGFTSIPNTLSYVNGRRGRKFHMSLM
ncbi:hypothetical protein MLD38_031142 [Melastoma candidum]|uniref:Uncharacterized protein n=1 Tax=Melastoma candidum TaxID=119954 RepID=A0ACB9MTQ2_9MYRT|nr:hypothetical protein MLD38_031142 [Melastoma candidum]